MPKATIVFVLALLLAPVNLVRAQPADPWALPPEVTTSHRLALPDGPLAYEAMAGTLELRNAKGEPEARIFHVAYRMEGPDPGTRPITYVFNGGPGAASAFLHIGGIGPWAFRPTQGPGPVPSGPLAENAATWLAFTDLVFVDPVGTGWSRSVEGTEEADRRFWEVGRDLDALARFVRQHRVRTGRTASPTYLAGESYGGFRTARLAETLQTDHGVDLTGIVMISPVLDFAMLEEERHELLPWVVHLPSLAAVNLEAQGRLTPDALRPVERFALTDYLVGLAAPRGAMDALVPRIAETVGLPDGVVARFRGRIPIRAFAKERGRGDGTGGAVASLYDGSTLTADPYPESPMARGPDILLQGAVAPFTTAFVHYAREALGYRTERPYAVLNGEVSGRWDYGRGGRSATGALDALREALSADPGLKAMIVHGVTDLVTPYFASSYVLGQMPMGERVRLGLYAGGHMMYLRAAPRAELAAEVRDFYLAAGPTAGTRD